MTRICILSHLHLSSNPRVWKEAILLSEAGYEVTILTAFNSKAKQQEDLKILAGHNIQYKSVINLHQLSFIAKGVNKLAGYFYKITKRLTGYESAWLLYVHPELFFKAALSYDADLYIAHAEVSFYTGTRLARIGKKVAFDFEDLYSHDYLVKDRPVQLLKKVEQDALQHGQFCICPSQGMANTLEDLYKVKKPVEVIYNGFSINERAAGPVYKKPHSIIWFSQTIGPGRGLETLLAALQLVDQPFELTLLGNVSDEYKQKLVHLFPGRTNAKLYFKAPVPHGELLPLLQTFEIGLALEEQQPLSRYVTVTNKILQYVQAGLKVIATATKGQKEIAHSLPQTISLIDFNNIEDWALNIKKALNAPSIDEEKQLKFFNQLYAWEVQGEKLLNLVEQSLNKRILHSGKNLYAAKV